MKGVNLGNEENEVGNRSKGAIISSFTLFSGPTAKNVFLASLLNFLGDDDRG